ncbi:HPr family phosphocarrier protein [Thalassolituus sp. LLYu03]|uniref:HPr family phosphocarrier protein n=1 Tax=Thalassolituus sp. LLYu03 TaxID=3421656 RepID=UPI003D283B67
MIQTQVTIINKLGLHARAAAKLVTTATAFGSRIRVGYPDRLVDGKSIMAVMMLAASKGTEILIEAEGDDEQAATDALLDLINRRFDEAE